MILAPMGMAGFDYEARLRKAAARGHPEAKWMLAVLRDTERLLGRAPRTAGLSMQFFASYRCPVCGGGAATASGRDRTLKCKAGHVRTAEGRAPGFSLKALLARRG